MEGGVISTNLTFVKASLHKDGLPIYKWRQLENRKEEREMLF